MPVETREISVTAKEDCGIVNITEMVSEEVENSKIRSGTVTVFCIGSTGAITTRALYFMLTYFCKTLIVSVLLS